MNSSPSAYEILAQEHQQLKKDLERERELR
jgi:hypothetical protein